jgi:Skp family chaperone for outer membrane proteins
MYQIKNLWSKVAPLLQVIFFPVTVSTLVWNKTKTLKYKDSIRAVFCIAFAPVVFFTLAMYATVGSIFTGNINQPSVAGVSDTKYSNEINKLSTKNKELEEELKNIKAKISDSESKKLELEGELKGVVSTLESTKNSLSELDNKKRELEKELLQAKEITQQKSNNMSITTPNNATKPINSNNSISNSSNTSSGYIAGSCKELAARGLGNWKRGDPNYNTSRDRDNDGIACEL